MAEGLSWEQLISEEDGLRRRGRRILWLGTALTGVAVVLIIRLFFWQVYPRQLPIPDSVFQQYMEPPAPLPRGSILDTDGHYLAVDTVVYDITASPAMITCTEGYSEPVKLAEDLEGILGKDPGEVLSQLRDDASKAWTPLASGIPDTLARQIASLGRQGIRISARYKRYYPERELFGPVLGYVEWFDDRARGGIETYWELALTGRAPKGYEAFKHRGSGPFELSSLPQNAPVADVTTTLDRTVQRMVHEELERALVETGAERAVGIVIDPRSGALRAVVNLPSFDPNQYPIYAGEDWSRFLNYGVTQAYEPGSVFKVLTYAMALDQGKITASTTFNDTGVVEIGGKEIRNSDNEAYGIVNTVEALAYSLNVEAVAVSTMLGPAVFYDYVTGFGIGQRTGVGLGDETAGALRVPGDLDWHISDLGTNAFGQGLSCTPLQMISAVGAVANDGLLMRPYIAERVDRGDREITRGREPIRQVISPEAAREASRILAESVKMHMRKAMVPGYAIAGKSGTAQIPVPGGYDPDDTIASFVGYGPIPDPEFAVLVRLDRPKTSEWGIVVAAPVFQRIAARLFDHYGIRPDEEQKP